MGHSNCRNMIRRPLRTSSTGPILASSDFYPKAISPSIKELKLAAENEVDASEQRVFDVNRLPVWNHAAAALAIANYRDAPFSSLISLYILADVLLVPDLKNSVISLLVEVYGFARVNDSDKGIVK